MVVTYLRAITGNVVTALFQIRRCSERVSAVFQLKLDGYGGVYRNGEELHLKESVYES